MGHGMPCLESRNSVRIVSKMNELSIALIPLAHIHISADLVRARFDRSRGGTNDPSAAFALFLLVPIRREPRIPW